MVRVKFYHTTVNGQVEIADISYDGEKYRCKGNKKVLENFLPPESEGPEVIYTAMRKAPRKYDGTYFCAALVESEKGSSESGHYDHAGLPGVWGGSRPSFGVSRAYAEKRAEEITFARSCKKHKVWTGPAHEAEVAWVARSLQRHPKEVVDSLQRVTMCRDTVAYEQLALRAGLGSGESTAFYIYSDSYNDFSSHIVFKDFETMVVREGVFPASVFDHEMGHHILWASRAESLWRSVYVQNPDFDRFTRYSEISSDEGFAETYMAYLHALGHKNLDFPRALEKIADKRVREAFLVVGKVIEGLE